MAQILTYNQIIDVLRDCANRHYNIHSFHVGQDFDIAANGNDLTPVLWAKPISGTFVKSTQLDSYPIKQLVMELKCLDLVDKGNQNRDDVHSDTHTYLSQIVTEIDGHPYFQRSGLQLIGDISLSPYEEFSDDDYSGWSCLMTFKMKNPYDFCGLPFSAITGFSFPGPDLTANTYSTQYLTCSDLDGCQVIIDIEGQLLTGGTFNSGTGTLTLFGSDNTISITGITTGSNFDCNDLTDCILITGLRTDIDSISAQTIQNASDILTLSGRTDLYVTGGTYSNGTLTLNRQDASVVISGFSTGSTDNYVTGATFNNNTLTLERQNGTVQVTGIGQALWTGGTGQNSIMPNFEVGHDASGTGSFIGGGGYIGYSIYGNTTSGQRSVVVNGQVNVSSGYQSFIGNGYNNKVTNGFSSIINGSGNIVDGSQSIILGGSGVNIHSTGSFSLGSGIRNNISRESNTILGGHDNTIDGPYNNIFNGNNNNIHGTGSTIIGGSTNIISSAVTNSVILGMDNKTANKSNTLFTQNIETVSFTGNTGRINSYLEMNSGSVIKTDSGSGQIDLDYQGTGVSDVVISDDSGALGNNYLYFSTNNLGGATLNSNQTLVCQGGNGQAGWRLSSGIEGIISGTYVFRSFIGQFITVNSTGATSVVSSQNALVNGGVYNSVIVGGTNLTADTPNTLFTQNARLAENGGVIYSGGTPLSNIFSTNNYYTTGVTYNGFNNGLTINTNLSNYTTTINTFTGVTVNGNTYVSGNLSGQTFWNGSSLLTASTTSTTINWSTANNFELQLVSSTTLTFTNNRNGQEIMLAIIQNPITSGRTVTWPSGIKWQGGSGLTPTQTASTGTTDIYTLRQINNIIYCVYAQNFS